MPAARIVLRPQAAAVRLGEAAGDGAGAGLGLAISRGFVEANGGRLLLQRPVDGRGASFAVSLPAGRPDAPA